MTHLVHLEVEIRDPETLRAIALVRAKQTGMTAEEFRHVETTHYKDDHACYWLRWVFNKTVPLGHAGISIEDCSAELMIPLST